MVYQLKLCGQIVVVTNLLEFPVLLLGIMLAFSLVTSLVLQKFAIPHIVVYLLTGFLISNTLLKNFDVLHELETWFEVSEILALGLIGFKIGTELKFDILKDEPKFIIYVLFVEAGATFIAVFLIAFLFTKSFIVATILGGLATATAPAATFEVIRKLRANGPLSTRVKWILALDDVLAVFIVETVFVVVNFTLGASQQPIDLFLNVWNEIGVAVIIGLTFGFLLDYIIERMDDNLEMMEITFAILIFVMGLTQWLETSVILGPMIIGAVATNRGGDNYERAGDLLEIVMTPIVTIFFVLVGARVFFGDFSPFPFLALAYLASRTVGKIIGARTGAKLADADPIISQNLGFGLLAQGGVALGLVQIAGKILEDAGKFDIANQIVTAVVISTLFSEIMGSYGTRFAIGRANEIGSRDEMEPHKFVHE